MTLIKEKKYDSSKRFWVTWEFTKRRMSVMSVLTMGERKARRRL